MGLLKRVRGTPLPAWVFIAGRIGNSIVVSVLMLVLLGVIGRVVYGVAIPTGHDRRRWWSRWWSAPPPSAASASP